MKNQRAFGILVLATIVAGFALAPLAVGDELIDFYTSWGSAERSPLKCKHAIPPAGPFPAQQVTTDEKNYSGVAEFVCASFANNPSPSGYNCPSSVVRTGSWTDGDCVGPQVKACILGDEIWHIDAAQVDEAAITAVTVGGYTWTEVTPANPPTAPAFGTCSFTVQYTCQYDSSNLTHKSKTVAGCGDVP